jgi:O-Antigen ligase
LGAALDMRSIRRLGLSRVWSVVSGLALGVFPQAGVAALVPAGLVSVVRQPQIYDRMVEGLIIAVALVRAVQSWRANGQPWTGLLEVALMWLLYRGLVALGTQRRVFGIGAALGLAVAMIAALVQAWSLAPFSLDWLEHPEVARLERIGAVSRYEPVQVDNAWVYLDSTIQGPGRVAFEFDLRAERPITVGTFINEYRLPGGPMQRLLEPCQVSTDWRTCRLEVSLPNRAVLNLGIGGNFTWKAGDPVLEFRAAHVRVTQAPTLLERLKTPNRTSGWSFNENGLGAWAAIVALIVIVTCRDWRWRALGLAMGLLGVFLSGSRGALLALALGLLVVILGRVWLRWPRVLPGLIALFISLFAISTFMTLRSDTSLPPSLRAFDPKQADSVTSRLTVYRIALEIIKTSPIIGVGDVQREIGRRMSVINPNLSGELHAHNFVLQVLGESGLIGLLIWLGLWWVAVKRMLRNRDVAGLALLVAVIVVNTVDYLFLYSPTQIAFWLALAGVAPRAPRVAEPRASLKTSWTQ